jgi:hypothetical protein
MHDRDLISIKHFKKHIICIPREGIVKLSSHGLRSNSNTSFIYETLAKSLKRKIAIMRFNFM